MLLKPLLGDYTIQVTGNGAGPFSLDFIGYDIAGAQSRVTLTGTTTAGANAMYRAIYSSVAGSQIQAAPLDTTPPAITLAASPNTLWPPNHKMVVVSLSGSVTDNQSGASGVDPSTAAFAVVDEYGQVQPSGSLTLDSAGNYSVAFSLEASRLGDDKDGRQYKVFVSAKDFAGNLGSAFTLVTVPHDQKH